MIHILCPWKLSNFQDLSLPCPSTSKILPPPWPWMSNFKWTPSLQVIISQLKENIIQEWLLDVIRSFLQVGFHFQCQLINLVWLSFPLSGFPFDFFSLCMCMNETKVKIKPSHVIFKLTSDSIVRFSPQTMQWYH